MAYQNVLASIIPPFRGIVHFKKGKNGDFITIEVRLFKGIVSLGSICKNLEYVDSVFNFTQKSNFQTNNINHYLDYLEGTPSNQYTTLKEFFKRVEVDDIKDCAKVRQLVWGKKSSRIISPGWVGWICLSLLLGILIKIPQNVIKTDNGR